jgi:CcmD family protein
MAYVAAAYLAVGLLLAGYLWTLWVRQRELGRTMQRPKDL